MRILSIETSCDETAISIVDCSGPIERPEFRILANGVLSQIDIHKEYGGVFPILAKREHGKALVPLFIEMLKKAGLYEETTISLSQDLRNQLETTLDREPELKDVFIEHAPKINKPAIDRIAVTTGPGLEPALWVGINFAKALGVLWSIPVLPVNHMEGHVVSGLLPFTETDGMLIGEPVQYPAIALLISGGHTELIHIASPLQYEKVGQTRDDAIGEAFDKVARTLGLPYPGGPEVSRLADTARTDDLSLDERFPRPMIATDDFDFSFSGLKTKVLYFVRDLPELTEDTKKKISREFEDAVTDVLIKKTKKALEQYGAQTLLVGGGVAANRFIKNAITTMCQNEQIAVYFPRPDTATDNALMIAMAGYVESINGKVIPSLESLKANGNWSIAEPL